MTLTNHMAQFDVAVQSRIQNASEFTTLNRAQKEKIFGGSLEDLNKKGKIHAYNEIND